MKVTRLHTNGGPWKDVYAFLDVETAEGFKIKSIKHLLSRNGDDYFSGPSHLNPKWKEGDDPKTKWNNEVWISAEATEALRKALATGNPEEQIKPYEYAYGLPHTTAPPNDVPAGAADQYGDDDGVIPF